MNRIAIRDWLLLTNLVNLICPCLKQSNWRFAIGGIIRMAHVCAIVLMNNSSWEYDCNLTYGCDQYTTMMISLQPYKSLIQHFCSLIVDGINFLCQDSEMDKLRKGTIGLEQRLNDRLMRLEHSNIAITIDDDFIPEEPNHFELYQRNRMHTD